MREGDHVVMMPQARAGQSSETPLLNYCGGQYAELGLQQQARAEAAEVSRINPTYNPKLAVTRLPFKDQAVRERYMAATRKAFE